MLCGKNKNARVAQMNHICTIMLRTKMSPGIANILCCNLARLSRTHNAFGHSFRTIAMLHVEWLQHQLWSEMLSYLKKGFRIITLREMKCSSLHHPRSIYHRHRTLE